MSSSFASKPDRGGCLSLWLGASVLFSVLALILILGVGGELTRRGLGLLFVLSIAAIVVDLVCIYGIYQWKRWGVIGLVATSLISLALNVAGGTATATTCISPFVQMGILWYLVNDKWDVFD
jgi:hypothetical protein